MPGKQRNLEVKAVDPDLSGPKARLYRIVPVAAAPGGLEVERDRVEELRAVLGISDERLVARGYADLVA